MFAINVSGYPGYGRQSSLHLEGPVWRNFGFQADFSSTGYGPSYTRVVYGFVTKNTGLYYGDLNVQLAGNEFLQFSKSALMTAVPEMYCVLPHDMRESGPQGLSGLAGVRPRRVASTSSPASSPSGGSCAR